MAQYRDAEALHIGTELLTLRTNTHTTTLAQKLLPLGLRLRRAVLLADRLRDIVDALKESLRNSHLVIMTGGLGPTFDDISREAASAATGRRLKEEPRLMHRIKAKFRLAKLAMPAINRRQALVLKGAHVLTNKAGTAPGQFLDLGDRALLLLPGPPRELESVWKSAWPYLTKKFGLKSQILKSFQIAGLPESHVEEMASRLLATMPKNKIESTILASSYVIDLIFRIMNKPPQPTINRIRGELKNIFEHHFLGEDGSTLERELGLLLSDAAETVAVAESCTGGQIADRLTNEPGSSKYFFEGFVSYSNESKINRLGVASELVERHGAVSQEVAQAMAQRAKDQSGADWAISVTGICGPSGGSAQKPVGLSWFGLARPNGTAAVQEKTFTGDRKLLKEKMSSFALDWLRRELLKKKFK
ncbi:MAG: CinA family nicotinamide mononucleotide deamidase-related protein [Elusimicrobia bacterium]|nr:CinA family nicotinamide mononucleotide deamidase-related protein [Elusimicrobiota bacterium]